MSTVRQWDTTANYDQRRREWSDRAVKDLVEPYLKRRHGYLDLRPTSDRMDKLAGTDWIAQHSQRRNATVATRTRSPRAGKHARIDVAGEDSISVRWESRWTPGKRLEPQSCVASEAIYTVVDTMCPDPARRMLRIACYDPQGMLDDLEAGRYDGPLIPNEDLSSFLKLLQIADLRRWGRLRWEERF